MANNTQKQEIINMLVSAGMSAKDIAEVLKGLGYGAQVQNNDNHAGGRKPSATREYEYVRKDGTVKLCTKKEYDFFMQNREKAEARANRTPEEVAKIKADNQKKSADADAAVCRKLEKAIGCKAGSITRSTITLDDAKALGFKGNRADLKALKAQCRAK